MPKKKTSSPGTSLPESERPHQGPGRTDDLYRRFLSLTDDLIAFLDRDLVYRKVNRAFCRAHGRSVEQIVGTPAREFHDTPYFRETMEPGLTGCLQGRTMRVQAWTVYPDRGRRMMDFTFYPFYEHGRGEIAGVVLSGHDITDLQTPEYQATRQRDRLESLLDILPTGVYIIDRHFNLEYVNPIVQAKFGPLDNGERKCFRYLAARSAPCPWCRSGDIFARRQPACWSWQRPLSADSRHRITYDVHAAPLADGDGTTMITWLYDVSHRQAATDQLQVLNEQLTTLINASPDGIFFKDGEGRWLLANRAGLRLFGLEGTDYTGKRAGELAHLSTFAAESLLACETSDEKAWQRREISCFDTVLPMADGSSRTYEVIKAPLFNRDGSRKALIVLSRDISKRVATEKALRSEMEKRREANISMRVLLDRYREARQEVEQQITAQLKKLVFPYLDLLEQSVHQDQAREHLKIIGSHLAAITDPFAKKLSDPILGLTPREMLVADLVRQGKSTAAIARTLNLSKRTIDAYRNSLRKKLRLTNKKVNLREHLRSVYSLND